LKSFKTKPYKEAPETLGEHLCKKRNLGVAFQKDIAERLGIDARTYSSWERDRTKPAVRHFPRIVAFLGYDPFPQPQTLGEQIRTRRWNFGLSQEKLAELLGVDEGSVMRWERVEWKPTARSRRLIEAFLSASPLTG
jgi:transcriptional regulator with XRE-family HTH domain